MFPLQYAPTIAAFEERHWESILEAMQEILSEGSRRRQSKLQASRASSDFDMEEGKAEENYILRSDEE